MATTRTFTHEVPVDKQTEVVATITSLYTKSVERFAEAQKKTLDAGLLQSADLMGAWKKIAQVATGSVAPTFFDVAVSSFGQFVDLQKGAIDLAVEQSHTFSGLAHERVDSFSKATTAVTTMVQDTAERVAATHKNAIEFSATQTRTLLDTFKKQAGVVGTPVEAATESMQRGFDTLVETQKEILSIASKRPQTTKANA